MRWKIGGAAVAVTLLLTMLPDYAEAQYGTGIRRRTRRRTAVVVGTSVHAADQAAAAQKQAATPTAAAPAPAAAPAAAPAPAAAVAVGTVVSTLPSGCVKKTVSGAEYHQCGSTWYRAAFEGNELVYVTTAPPG